VYILLWYGTSVICTNTSKQLGIHWSILTLSQLSISSLCGFLLINCLKFVPYQPIVSSSQLRSTALLAAVFTMGFLTLNSALGMMHVSLVMTLRATEPLFTLVLAAALLKSERASPAMAAALLPVIAGAALSSVSSSGDPACRAVPLRHHRSRIARRSRPSPSHRLTGAPAAAAAAAQTSTCWGWASRP
jgi:drug/metabolite transporter (DMT)-like permease